MKKDRVGEKHFTREGYTVKIILYKGKDSCTIQFEDGFIINEVSYSQIKNGKIKNPYHPSVCNRGYIGKGLYKTSVKSKHLKVYILWCSIFKRCYEEQFLERYPTYKNCSMDEHWYNFQNFSEWFYGNYKPEYMEGWHLDKDILVKGNKIYSPETCCFVPQEINHLLSKAGNIRGKYPIGVYLYKGKYQAQISKYGLTISLGSFIEYEEAFQAYKKAKEDYIREVAEKWKAKITEECYNTLINYKVEITD